MLHRILIHLAGNPQDVVVPVEGVAGGGTSYGWNDGGTHDLSHFKGSIEPTEIPTKDLVHVWFMPSTANIGTQDMPRHVEPVSIFILYSYSSADNLMAYYLKFVPHDICIISCFL